MEIRRAVVVGGAGGIGGAICRNLASEGYRVVVADFNLEAAQEVFQSLDGEGHGVSHLDITSEESVGRAFDAIEASSPAGILVVASGGPVVHLANRVDVSTMTMSDWMRTIDLNLTGVFVCVRKFAQLRQANALDQSRIVIIGSAAGLSAGGGVDIAYVTTKAAVFGFVRQSAYELAHSGITVNVVAPGPVETAEFVRRTDEQIRAGFAAAIPLKRLGTPDDVAGSVAYLLSPQASYITGASIDVTGGSHMR